MNFEKMNRQLRERVHWRMEDYLDKLVRDHLLKGGKFDATKITTMFHDCVNAAQLVEDLVLGVGLNPLKDDEENEVSDNRSRDSQGPTKRTGLTSGICDSARPADTAHDHGSAGGGEVNPPQQ